MTAMRGFTLLETLTSLIIVAVMAAVLAPLAASLMDANRAGQTYDELAKIHTAIVGDPRKGTYGYIGDVGKFPDSLLDLVEKPASNPPGWNGPYLADARVEAGILYDVYGSPIECYYFRDNANSVADQFVLISRGADRSSTNTSATPNQCATYAGAPLPSAAGYVSSALNIDNVVYPRFTDNAALLSYQHLGTLAVNIMNFDQNALVSALVPGCPHLYNITVTSVPRGSNDTLTMPFNPGGDSVDLPAGLYNVRVTSQTALGSLWEEQVAITAGTTTSRQVNIFAGVNSSQTPNETFRPINTMGGGTIIAAYEFTTLIGVVADGAQAPASGSWLTLNPCSQVFIRNSVTNVVLDAFIYPYLVPTNTQYLKRINTAGVFPLVVVNRNVSNLANRKQVLVYDQGIFIGVVSDKGSKKSKTILNVKSGDTITVYDLAGSLLNTPVGTTMGSGLTTISLP